MGEKINLSRISIHGIVFFKAWSNKMFSVNE